MPQRHAKNNGSSTYGVFSYHERRKCEFMRSEKARLGKDAQLPFGHCALSLQPAVDPVVTPSGHIYSREAILEHLVAKTAELKRAREAWEAERVEADRAARAEAARRDEALRDELESSAVRVGERPSKVARTDLIVAELSKTIAEPETSLTSVDKPDASFWLPELAPSAAKAPAPEPPRRPPSPLTGAPLRVKDLASIELRRAESAKATGVAHDGADVRFLCHVSNDEITTQPALFIRSTGCVVLQDVADRLGVLRSRVCPITSRKFKDKDVLRLVTSNSAYAARGGDGLVVTKYRPGGGGA